MAVTTQEVVETEEIVSDLKRYLAEAVGTFVLVFVSVGTAVIAGAKVGNLGVALAFGLTLLFLVYSIGPISGCHVNPAVTFGQFLIGRIEATKALLYVAAQVIGGLVAGAALFVVARSLPSFDRSVSGFGANGWGAHSPSATKTLLGEEVLQNGYGIGATIVIEVLLTALLVFVVLAATDRISNVPLAGVAIGFALAAIHIMSIPVDNTSVNPARSFAVAWYQNGAPAQLWAFIVFPLIGGALGALAYRGLFGRR
ncbi:aquaporin [Rhodococcus sp. NPDC127528]|uniref:aquaporin n=1 Tax=unclassified Rhodococcus (in: high G+C Gram-positive bacteria) TaxID=192944 RepID=UPI0036441745